MTLEEQLKYQSYEHQYQKNDILILKNSEDINEINKILTSENPDAFINVSWYLTNEKINQLSTKRLRILNCISWHMGIPFYEVEDIENKSSIVHIGEFYLTSP